MSKWAFLPVGPTGSDLPYREIRFPELSWKFRGNVAKSPKSEHFSEVSQKRAHSTFGPVHSTRSESRTSMLLGRHQNVGIGPIYPFNHRVTHDRQSKTEKAAESGILGQNGLSPEAPLPPKPLSMHLGHVPRRGNVYPDTLASTAMHGAWPQGPKSGSKDGGFSTIKLIRLSWTLRSVGWLALTASCCSSEKCWRSGSLTGARFV